MDEDGRVILKMRLRREFDRLEEKTVIFWEILLRGIEPLAKVKGASQIKHNPTREKKNRKKKKVSAKAMQKFPAAVKTSRKKITEDCI